MNIISLEAVKGVVLALHATVEFFLEKTVNVITVNPLRVAILVLITANIVLACKVYGCRIESQSSRK